MAAGLLVARITGGLLPDTMSDTAVDVVFSLIMQAGFLFIGTFLVCKLYLRRSVRGVFSHCNYRMTSPWILLLCVPLGVCCLVITLGVSTIWYSLISSFGFSSSSSSSYPAEFSVGPLFAQLALSALLPAVCEEFAHRGAVDTALRGTFSESKTILMGGLCFGLFHQNITQIFYTFLFGMFITYLLLRTKSILPGMIVHFVNNGVSVYLDFADAYKNTRSLPLGRFFDGTNALMTDNFMLVFLVWALFVAAAAGIVMAIRYLAAKDVKKRYAAAEKAGESIPLSPGLMYRPAPSDWAFYAGALAMAAITTVLTFVWGLS